MNPAPLEGAPAALTPTQKLEASRARLRAALQSARGESTSGSDPAAGTGKEASFTDALFRAAHQVWMRHPLRAAMGVFKQIVGPELLHTLRPMAASNPLGLVLAGAAVGMTLVWLRPWRLLPKAALTSVLISQLFPRRELWQALMNSGLDKLTNLDTLVQWLNRSRAQTAKPEAEASSPQTTAAKASVLHPEPPVTDTARAA